MVVPLPTVEHPAGTHVARSIETVHIPVDDDRLSRGVGAVLVSVPPASSVAFPGARLARRGRCTDVDHGARRYERGLRRIIDGHRRIPRTHRCHGAVLTDRGHGLVRGGPHHIGHARIRGLVGGAQPDALPDGQGRASLRERKRRHGNGLQIHLHRPLVHRPVPHLQVHGRRIATRTLGNLRQRHLEVAAVPPIVPAFVRTVELLAHERLAVRAPREAVRGDRRGIGGVEGERTLISFARYLHVGNDGRRRVQRYHVGEALGTRRGTAGRAFDRERIASVGQRTPLLVIPVKERLTTERSFRGADLGVASIRDIPTLGRSPVGV